MQDDLTPISEGRPRSRWGWYAVQVAIVAAVTVGGYEGSGRQLNIGVWAAIGIGLAAFVTVFGAMTIDWFRYRPARDKLIWGALIVAMTAAGGSALIFAALDPGEVANPRYWWVPFALAFPFAVFVWLIIGVGGLFRRSPKRGLPLVEQERSGSLPIGNRLRAK